MKKFFSFAIFLTIFVLFGYYLDKNIGLILSTFKTTSTNLTKYFFLSTLLVFLHFLFLAKSYQVVFRMNKLFRKTWELIKLNFIGMFVNVIVPTGGLSQAVIYAENSKKRGDSQPKTINSVIITYISDYTSISLFLLFSLLYLKITDQVIPHVVIPAILFILLTFFVYLLAFFSGKESKMLEKFINFITEGIDNFLQIFIKKGVDVSKHTNNLYHEFKQVNKAILEDPKDWTLAILYSTLSHFCSIFALYLIFISLGEEPLIRTIIAAYSVGAAFVVISPTPNGIGFVEGGMYLVFTNLGTSGTVATTAVILYRGLSFWIPLFLGFVVYQKSKIEEIIKKKRSDE